MQCPSCDAEIGRASYCGCGWKRSKKADGAPYMPPPPCAYDGCGRSAYVRLKVKTGLANLCDFHYQEHFRKQANETCKRLDLKTVAQMREWVRKNPIKIKRVSALSVEEQEIEAIPF